MNITTIESDDRATIKAIASVLVLMNLEFEVVTANEPLHETIFIVKCSRTNHELFTIHHMLQKLTERDDLVYEIRGVANDTCNSALHTKTLDDNDRRPYEGVFIQSAAAKRIYHGSCMRTDLSCSDTHL